MAFAGWASSQVADTSEIIRRFMPLWDSALQGEHRQALVDMALQAAEIGRQPTRAGQCDPPPERRPADDAIVRSQPVCFAKAQQQPHERRPFSFRDFDNHQDISTALFACSTSRLGR